jgi:hypothetical protein
VRWVLLHGALKETRVFRLRAGSSRLHQRRAAKSGQKLAVDEAAQAMAIATSIRVVLGGSATAGVASRAVTVRDRAIMVAC